MLDLLLYILPGVVTGYVIGRLVGTFINYSVLKVLILSFVCILASVLVIGLGYTFYVTEGNIISFVFAIASNPRDFVGLILELGVENGLPAAIIAPWMLDRYARRESKVAPKHEADTH